MEVLIVVSQQNKRNWFGWAVLLGATLFATGGLAATGTTLKASERASDLADDLATLRTIEQRVRQVVKENLPATVSVTDGIGYGSGVVVSRDGLVLTAGHVLMTGGSNFRVIFPNGREVKAKVLGKNLDVDAGMLQLVEPGPYPSVELGDARILSRGRWVVCLGHSGGYELGRKPPVRAGRILDFEPDTIVTDCVLIGGDSGGPLFDIDGRLIGIHSNIGTSIAENRHVSINTFMKHWDRMQGGDSWGKLPDLEVIERPRAGLGVRVDLENGIAEITTVHRGGAAEAAELQVGDRITRFDGIDVRSAQHLIDLVKQRQAGEQIVIEILRNGKLLEKSIRLQMLGK